MAKTVVKWVLVVFGAVTLLAMAALAVPVQQWRTGEVPQPVFKGCGAAAQKCLDDGGSLDAHTALRQVLQRGTLDFVALGPLTNLAAVLAAEPALAARQVSMTGSDLDRVALAGPAARWVAERSRAWLEFWRSEAGLDGFYPFDLMAAAYVRDPTHFGCARVTAWVGHDALLPWFSGGPALLVAQQTGLPSAATATAQALYCDVVRGRVDELFP